MLCPMALGLLQANIVPATDFPEWPLDDLANKVGQYCELLKGLTGDDLRRACDGDYEKLRTFLHDQGEAAYFEKARTLRSRTDPSRF
jgi:preprotein translocase subunit SecA